MDRTALMVATIEYRPEIVELLLKHNPDVKKTDKVTACVLGDWTDHAVLWEVHIISTNIID